MASILAISASQSGPAHSFIVGEALKSAAARAGHTLGLKVISHLGEQGSFSDDELAKADVAIVVADGPVDLSSLPKTLRIFESTPQAVFDDADGVLGQALAGSGGAAKAAPAAKTAAPGGKPPAGMKVVAITSCPTGVAHTFMAAEALEEGAETAGYTIKVETRGSVGAQNTLTPEEIAAADLVVIAADTQVDKSRFVGKRLYSTSTKAAIHDAGKVFDTAWAEATPWGDGKAAAAGAKEEAKAGSGGRSGPYKHLMTGVSFMLPFVVAGGLLIALAFAIGGLDVPSDPKLEGTLGWYLFQVGAKYAFTLMVPILAGYITFSIADRPGLAAGLVGGYLAAQGRSGFIGALIAGFAAGYIVLFLKKAFIKLPKALDGLKPILFFPLFGIAVTGIVMQFIVEPPIGALNTMCNTALASMSGTGSVVLGLILGGMMAVDMGGPVNKAAYVFGTASIAAGNYNIMAAVMIGGMVPPLALALSALLFKSKYTQAERKAAPANIVMGLSFITEGAIPFAASDPLHVLPCCIVGSALAGGISMAAHCTLMAPHGGIFVFPVVGNPFLYLVALVAGSLVAALLLGFTKKKVQP